MFKGSLPVHGIVDMRGPSKEPSQVSGSIFDMDLMQLPRLKAVKLTTPNDQEWLEVKKQFAKHKDIFTPESSLL